MLWLQKVKLSFSRKISSKVFSFSEKRCIIAIWNGMRKPSNKKADYKSKTSFNMKAEINPKKGFGELAFGQSMEQTIKTMGKPSEVEQIGEVVEMPTTVLHYDDYAVSLFFDNVPEETLVCINIESPDAVLFGEKIMGRSSKEIIELMKRNNASSPDRDKEEWGEERLGYEDFSIDFYFDDDKLESVTIGK